MQRKFAAHPGRADESYQSKVLCAAGDAQARAQVGVDAQNPTGANRSSVVAGTAASVAPPPPAPWAAAAGETATAAVEAAAGDGAAGNSRSGAEVAEPEPEPAKPERKRRRFT